MFSSGRILPSYIYWLCLGFIFFYISLVPYRYLGSIDSALFGRFVWLLAWLPSIISVALFSFLVIDPRFNILCRNTVAKITVFILGAGVLGAFGSLDPLGSLSREVYYFISGPFFGGIAFVIGFGQRQHIRYFLVLMFSVSVVVSFYGVIEFLLNENIFWDRIFSFENMSYRSFADDVPLFGSRILSTLGHPVYLGAYLVLSLPLGGVLFYSGSRVTRILAVFGILLVIVALVLTFSRGSWLSVIFTCLASVFYLRKNRLITVRLFPIAIALFCVFILLFSFDKVREAFHDRGTLKQIESIENDPRIRAYSYSVNVLLIQPVWGVGTGQYGRWAIKFGDNDNTPDNMYLRTLAEKGMLGFILFLYLITRVLTLIRSKLHRFCTKRSEVFFLGCSIIGFCSNMITCDALNFSVLRIMFWLLIGFSVALLSDESP